MQQKTGSRLRALTRHQMSRVVAGVVTAAVLAVAAGSSLLRPVAGEPAKKEVQKAPTFRPTEAQWKGLTIAPVTLRTFRTEEVTEGNIATDDDLSTPVFSPYSGHVVRLMAKLGDHLERGAPLLSIEATEFVQSANTLITAAAAAKTARSQVNQAEINERRSHDLYLAKGGALKDWQQAQTDLITAQNGLRSAEVALAAARNQLRILGKSDNDVAALEAQPTQRLDPVAVVVAPIAGNVTQRQVGLGQYIQSVSAGASNPVYTIGDLSTVWLIANVREANAGRIQVGMPVEVRVPAYPSRVFNARISWVAPSLDANTHRLPVRADVPNADGALKPMMFANFTIITGEASAMPSVPQNAIIYEGATARVWLAHDDGTIESRSVPIGRAVDGVVEIIDGLSLQGQSRGQRRPVHRSAPQVPIRPAGLVFR